MPEKKDRRLEGLLNFCFQHMMPFPTRNATTLVITTIVYALVVILSQFLSTTTSQYERLQSTGGLFHIVRGMITKHILSPF